MCALTCQSVPVCYSWGHICMVFFMSFFTPDGSTKQLFPGMCLILIQWYWFCMQWFVIKISCIIIIIIIIIESMLFHRIFKLTMSPCGVFILHLPAFFVVCFVIVLNHRLVSSQQDNIKVCKHASIKTCVNLSCD